ncbi:MAG: carboxymuconolactone decarboxylase family protein [Acidobacteriota bacterium]
MDERERHTAGLEMRRRVLGQAHVDKAIARTTELTADFQELLTRYAWGEIWTRPGLDVRARRLIVLGTLIALGRWEELALHARAAIVEGGFSAADLKEIALQQAIYCGVPAANKAFEILSEVIAESEK